MYFTVSALYFAGMESSRHQATFGKLALYIGFLMAAFTERKRALHDMVSSTQVVDRWAYTEFPEHQSPEQVGRPGYLNAT